jgi:predicted negative regulator of RcsB-dependent stress response
MNTWLKENWFKVGLLIILIISVAGAFYWYSYRPTQIRKECAGGTNFFDQFRVTETQYVKCLRIKGLDK